MKYLPLTMFSHQIWRYALNCEKGKEKESKGDINNQSNQCDSHLNCDMGSGKIIFKKRQTPKTSLHTMRKIMIWLQIELEAVRQSLKSAENSTDRKFKKKISTITTFRNLPNYSVNLDPVGSTVGYEMLKLCTGSL